MESSKYSEFFLYKLHKQLFITVVDRLLHSSVTNVDKMGDYKAHTVFTFCILFYDLNL